MRETSNEEIASKPKAEVKWGGRIRLKLCPRHHARQSGLQRVLTHFGDRATTAMDIDVMEAAFGITYILIYSCKFVYLVSCTMLNLFATVYLFIYSNELACFENCISVYTSSNACRKIYSNKLKFFVNCINVYPCRRIVHILLV